MSVHFKHLGVLGWLLCGLLISQVQAKSLPEFTSLVDQYGPTVVNISTTARKMSGQDENGSPKMPPGIPEDSPLN
jgi:serine protease Do